MNKLRFLFLASLLTLSSTALASDLSFTLQIGSKHHQTVSLMIPAGNSTIEVVPDNWSRVSCSFYDPKSHFTGLEQKNYTACSGEITLASPLQLEVTVTNEDRVDHNYTLTIRPTKA